MTSINWNAASGVIRQEIYDALQDVLIGTSEDLEEFAEKIATRVVRAAERGDEVSQASLGRTMRLLAHKHELMARNVGWDLVERVILSIVRVGVGAVVAALPSPSS